MRGGVSLKLQHSNKVLSNKVLSIKKTPQTPQKGAEEDSRHKLLNYFETQIGKFYKSEDHQLRAAKELLERYDKQTIMAVINILAEGNKHSFTGVFKTCPNIRALSGLNTGANLERVKAFVARKVEEQEVESKKTEANKLVEI